MYLQNAVPVQWTGTTEFSLASSGLFAQCRPRTLRWRHNGRDSVSNHQPHDCLLNSLFRSRSKKTSKFRVTGLCAGNSPGTGDFPAQMASNAEMFPFNDVIMKMAKRNKNRHFHKSASSIIDLQYLPLNMCFQGGKSHQVRYKCIAVSDKSFKIQDGCHSWPLIPATTIIHIGLSAIFKQLVLPQICQNIQFLNVMTNFGICWYVISEKYVLTWPHQGHFLNVGNRKWRTAKNKNCI